MTIRDLQRFVQEYEEEGQIGQSAETTRLVSNCPKTFYKWSDKNHWSYSANNTKQCCFWHWTGAPQKDGLRMPVLPYQRLLYRMLKERRHIWIKKSRGLGVTTFFLYWIAHCCLTRYEPGDRVCIVVGPGIDIAEDWIARFKSLFRENFPIVYSELIKQQRTVAILNGVRVEAFPSHHVDTMRGLDKVRTIISDETDYYPPFQQKEVRAVMEGYIGKPNSDPHIILVSTPKNPGGLLQTIELEQNSLYYKMFLTYEYGLEGPRPIYSKEQLVRAKKSPDFPREYEGKYIGVSGNIFASRSIENCQKVDYNPDQIIPDCKVSIGIDPSFGSKFGIVATRFVNERIEVFEAEEYERPDFSDMINRVWEIKQQHRVDNNNLTIYVDAANPEIWQSLKRNLFNEPYAERYVFDKLAYYKKLNMNPAGPGGMIVIPTPFNSQGAKMLQAAKGLLEDKDNLLLIDKRFDKLLTALRTAVAREYKLDKEATSYHDILDAFRLSLQLYQRSTK